VDPSNAAIADALEELGDLYELDGAVVHRVLAYRNGARAVRDSPVSVAALARQDRATELAGIGATLQEKILALADGGAIPAAEKLRAKFPPGLIAITRLPGIGPKRALLLHAQLGIDSPAKLREAAQAQRLREVRGLGPRFEQSVLEAFERLDAEEEVPPAPPPELLAHLIELSDIRGDLHCHTIASDGHNTIGEMARAARARGYEYLAITDHSASHGFGNEVSPQRLRKQIELVREANAAIDGIELLAGSEVNILPDGSLDYEDELLAELDWIVASVHTAFNVGEQRMTERVITAIEHPLVDAIGHPTGRLIERRAPYAIELQAVFAAAAHCGTLLEINGSPARRDLSEANARAAAQAGVRIVIDSDAHRVETLANMRWGVATARQGWLTKQDVANTRPWAELKRQRGRPTAADR
jgi:histidinol phosphatase-like PHP family hydrolase